MSYSKTPWKQSASEPHVIWSAVGTIVCTVRVWGDQREAMANARLISLAPEMLEALKNRHGDCPCRQVASQRPLCTVGEILAKAEPYGVES